MPIEFLPAGLGIFGTDATKIYAEPTNVILRYKKSPDELVRIYLHMLFHCIYLHPFLTKYGVNTAIWDVAIDICAEAAVMRLKPYHLMVIQKESKSLSLSAIMSKCLFLS